MSDHPRTTQLLPLVNAHKEQKPECKGQLKFLIIGAGSRGNAYAKALQQCESSEGVSIGAIAEPIDSKRKSFKRRFVREGESCKLYRSWEDFIKEELDRRTEDGTRETLDGVFICVLDEMHAEIITALAPLGLHIMSEKPLATTLHDCLRIYRTLQPAGVLGPDVIFSICHVLRYSPHNMLLRKLLLEDQVIGDVLSIEHTEPVGYWHFAHSYVRGNWRKESSAAPSLLTKSCHDIDLLLWLLCSPPPGSQSPPYLPSDVSSTGSLLLFRDVRKPALAGNATNCLTCPAESECIYSAKKIYVEKRLDKGIGGWPVNIVDSEIEELMTPKNQKDADSETKFRDARSRLLERLGEDYIDGVTPQAKVQERPWFGRCVYESDNDVCDDQIVTIQWRDDPLSLPNDRTRESRINGRGAKIATFHMVASTEKQCERRGRIYGTKGEIEYDSKSIRVFDFSTSEAKIHHPQQLGGGHGGGDAGLAQQFVKAILAVKRGEMSVAKAQTLYIGCSLEEIIRSHAMVFAAEEARKERKVVDWADWWARNVEKAL